MADLTDDPIFVEPVAPEPAAPPRRIPHFGHALLFLAIAAVFLLLIQAVLFARAGTRASLTGQNPLLTVDPKLLLGSEAAAYVATLGLSAVIFPRLWDRPFLDGIGWRGAAAERQFLRLVPLGFVLSLLAQAALSHFSPPHDLPIDRMFHSAGVAWLTTAFGVVLAPAFEEIAFRGFLFPACAIAYDWLSLPRTPEARARWDASATLTPLGLWFSAVVTSLLFAMLHAQQLAFTVPALVALFAVSLVLTLVRARTGSVACSAVVHASYNGLVFLVALIETGGYRHLDKLTQ